VGSWLGVYSLSGAEREPIRTSLLCEAVLLVQVLISKFSVVYQAGVSLSVTKLCARQGQQLEFRFGA
jgi:hypothetical protein